MPKLELKPDIHILDCTKLAVCFKNEKYEGSAVALDSDNKLGRGYKLATIRGVTGDDQMGIIEDIRFGSMEVHDLKLSEDMLYNSPVLKHGDILINDRGFISRDMMNYLKNKRGVDTYIPLKCNMNTYEMAVSTAKMEKNWMPHPNKNRKSQRIAFVPNLGAFWRSDDPESDVDINACVVWDTEAKEKEKEYFVFVTTDLTKSAKQIVQTYEIRPEVEEQFRQLKDFWEIQSFKSTKLNFISYHITSTLYGYLFYQLYMMFPEGEKYYRKCLPVVLKNYIPEPLNYLVFYAGDYFAVLSIIEFAQIYASCDGIAKERFNSLVLA
jgi:hypothetical protein